MDPLGWETFWLPNILQSLLFAGLAAAVGALVGFFIRRHLGKLFDGQNKTILGAAGAVKTAAGETRQAAGETKQAAAKVAKQSAVTQQSYDDMKQSLEDLARRNNELMTAVLRQASLDLRLRRIEKHLENLEVQKSAAHAAPIFDREIT